MIIFAIIIMLLLNPVSTQANSGDFSLRQDINYYFDNNGHASVQHHYQIINNFSQIYPQEYTLEFPGTDIDNISAHDNVGNILTKVQKQSDHLDILLRFNRPQIGKNQATIFTLSYRQLNLAKPKGTTREIELPQFTYPNDNDVINLYLDIPSNYGELSFSSVGQPQVSPTGTRLQLTLTNSQIKNHKILLIFGNYQLFDFDLSYLLKNPNQQPITTEISLPPDTSGQQILFRSITPLPQNVRSDPDGNWLASYQLNPNQQLEIEVLGQAKIFPPKFTPISIDQSIYLQEQRFWPVNSPSIKNIALSLTTPKDIYNFVTNKLTYNYNLITQAKRRGAISALESPDNSLCTEFTDLFVTLARAKNIPAREIEGYAVTNNPKIKPINTNTDILHAWPQYYHSQKQTWIDVDPTWGKTTHGIDYFNELDLNHFTFTIHGLNSQLPPPPNKSVLVTYATDNLPPTDFPPEIRFDQNRILQNPTIVIRNLNNHSLTNLTVDLSAASFSAKIDHLPPFGHQIIKLPKIFWSQILNFEVHADESPSKQIRITNNFHYLHLCLLIATLITFLSIGGIILTIGRTHKST